LKFISDDVIVFDGMEQLQQYPPPIQAIAALASNFSREHFEHAIGECRIVLSNFIADDNSSEQQISRVRILRHIDFQLSRAVRWIDQEADLMALVLRSFIELRFWADYVSQEDAKADHFLKEAITDSKDIYDRLVKAFPEEATELEFDAVVKRERTSTHGEEEEFLYKICSKFLHPASLVLGDREGTILNEDYRKIFAIKVIYYAWGIMEMFHTIEWIK
jgi:hypothetical protein